MSGRSAAVAVLVIALVGCAARRPVPEPPQPPTPRFEGTSEEQALYRALSVRDPAPDCADAEAGLADPVPSLVRIAEGAQAPPWAPLRAAGCLVRRHGEAAEPHLRDWVVDPRAQGLAEQVLTQIDLLPEAVAVEVVRDALGGPWAELAEDAAASSDRPDIRALLP